MIVAGRGTGSALDDRGLPDRRDAEIERLRTERDRLRAQLRAAYSEAEGAQRRLSLLAAASKRFASSIRGGADARRRSRRRLNTQYALGRALAEAESLSEAAPRILEILGEGLRWRQTVLWTVDEAAGVLRCGGAWRSPDAPPDGFEDASRRTRLPRGACLPGRVWETREPVWVEDLREDEGFLRKEAAEEEGLRGALAFPIRDGGTIGVLELFCREPAHPDEDLLSTSVLIGYQIGQFVQRRRAEEDRERLLVGEREARAEAERARARTVSTLESISDAFFALDRDMRFAYVNREAERAWGLRREEIIGRSMTEMLPRAPGSEDYRVIERAAAERTVERFETVSAMAPGRWVSGSVYPAADGVSVYFRDVTEHKRAEEALAKSEERYRSLTEATSSIVWTGADDGSCVEEMPSWEEFTGQPFEEYGGFGWLDAVHPEDRPPENAWEKLSPEDAPVEAEYRLRRRDGEYRRVVSRGVPIFDERGGIREWVGTITDVEDERRTEEEHRRARAREREAREEAEAANERLAFLAGAAEERRRISRELHDRVAHSMGVVHQSLELHGALRERTPAMAEAKLQQARGLAKEALDSTRDLSMALRNSEVEEGLGPALSKLVGTTVPPDVRYAVSVDGDESLVPQRVRDQVFLILREAVRNAVAHSGCASIAVELDVAPERIAGSVEDDGEGFDPEEADDNGTGGLRSMRERAGTVGGTCELASGPDGGTRVEVFVPLGGTR